MHKPFGRIGDDDQREAQETKHTTLLIQTSYHDIKLECSLFQHTWYILRMLFSKRIITTAPPIQQYIYTHCLVLVSAG